MKNKFRNIVHLRGSPTNNFFYDLSFIYSNDILEPPNWKQIFITIDPEKNYYLSSKSNSRGKKIHITNLISYIPSDSLIIPHLFCYSGMTDYRNYFETFLNFRLLGSTGYTMGLATDKHKTKKIVKRAGLSVADGILVHNGQIPRLKFPFILKPNKEDNSTGVVLIKNKHQFKKMITLLKKNYNQVLAEEFVPGREIRVAVIERNNEFYVPAMIEYLVSTDYPIRHTEDKLDLNNLGLPYQQSNRTPLKSVCPANVENNLKDEIIFSAISAHKALGARHYSLFDFRIDERTNKPIFLEAGLFWSFSKLSMISKMLYSGGDNLLNTIDQIWHQALDLD